MSGAYLLYSLWKDFQILCVMAECQIPFSGHCVLDHDHSFKNCCVQRISIILFNVGIPLFFSYSGPSGILGSDGKQNNT